jgi:hypothetical protein
MDMKRKKAMPLKKGKERNTAFRKDREVPKGPYFVLIGSGLVEADVSILGNESGTGAGAGAGSTTVSFTSTFLVSAPWSHPTRRTVAMTTKDRMNTVESLVIAFMR